MYKHKYEQNKSNDQVYHFVLKYNHKILYIHLYSPSCNRKLSTILCRVGRTIYSRRKWFFCQFCNKM